MNSDELKVRTIYVDWKGENICYYDPNEVNEVISGLKVIISQKEDAINKAVDIAFDLKKERDFTKRAMWLARANAAKNKARFFGWSFDSYNTTLLINIDGHKYKMPKQSRMMTCHDWIEIFERVEERCRKKAEDYK